MIAAKSIGASNVYDDTKFLFYPLSVLLEKVTNVDSPKQRIKAPF